MAYINNDMYVRGPQSACSDEAGICHTDTDGSVYCGNPAYACAYPDIETQDPKCTGWGYSPCTTNNQYYLDRRKREIPNLGSCNDSLPQGMCGIGSDDDWRRKFTPACCGQGGDDMASNPPLPPPYPLQYKPPGKEGFVSGQYRRKGNEPQFTRDIFSGCQFNVRPEIFRSNTAGNFDLEEAATDMVYHSQDDQVYPTSLTTLLKGHMPMGTPEWKTAAMRSDLRDCRTIQSLKYQARNNSPDWYPTRSNIDVRYQCS